MTDGNPNRSPLERHVQSGLLVLCVSLSAWVGSSVVELGRSVAIIETTMGMMTAQLAGAYSAKDAARDTITTNQQLDELRRRVDKVERQPILIEKSR